MPTSNLHEAWSSLGAALSELMRSQRRPTRDEDLDAKLEAQRQHIVALRGEVKRLEDALAMAEARVVAPEVAEPLQSREGEERYMKAPSASGYVGSI